MAFLPTGETDDEKLRRLEGGDAGLMNQAAPQLSGGLDGGAAGGAAAAAPGGVQRRGGAPQVSLDQYLAANRGAVGQLGTQVEGAITGAGSAARGALGQASSAFNDSVSQNEVTANPNLGNDLRADPMAILNDPARLAALTRQRDATYNGPRALEETAGYGDVSRRLLEAREVGELAKSESGVGELSNRVVSGTRTTGGRALDSQLLRADEGLRGRLDTARAGLGTLDTEVGAASTAAQDRAGQAQKTTAATREQTRGALVTAQNALEKQLDEAVATKRALATQRAQEAQNAIAGTQYGKEQLPTAGAQGRYYADNDPTKGSFQDTAIKGNTPEFIHNVGGQQMLGQFNTDVANYSSAQANATARPQTMQALADLGISPEQMAQLLDLAPVKDMANASAMGTSNVNPYSFVEDLWNRIGDPTRFITTQNADAQIGRANNASTGDYDRAGALQTLAGDVGRTILNQGDRAQAGTASADLVNLDYNALMQQRAAALAALGGRTQATVAGNSRSGGDSFIKKYGQALAKPETWWTGPGGPVVAGVSASR